MTPQPVQTLLSLALFMLPPTMRIHGNGVLIKSALPLHPHTRNSARNSNYEFCLQSRRSEKKPSTLCTRVIELRPALFPVPYSLLSTLYSLFPKHLHIRYCTIFYWQRRRFPLCFGCQAIFNFASSRNGCAICSPQGRENRIRKLTLLLVGLLPGHRAKPNNPRFV